MKILILLLALVSSAFAQEETVIKVMRKTTHTLHLTIEEDSFEPNILGYACPWPGLRAPFVFEYWAKLKHGGGFGKDVMAIKESDLDHQFCHWPSAEDVFGKEFVVGKELKMSVVVELVLVKIGKDKLLKEIISSHLFGRNLESVAYLNLNNEN